MQDGPEMLPGKTQPCEILTASPDVCIRAQSCGLLHLDLVVLRRAYCVTNVTETGCA